MSKRLGPYLLTACLIALINGCSTSSDLASNEVSAPYVGSELNINPEFKVFHHTTDSSTLFVKFETENLLYVKSGDDYEAIVTIEIEPIPAKSDGVQKLKSKKVAVPGISSERKGDRALARVEFYLPISNLYSLEITISDAGNGKKISKLLETNKNAVNSRENFQAYESGSSVPMFTDRIKPNKAYQLIYGLAGTRTVQVNYYNRSFPLPPPPFAYYEPKAFNYRPDDTFELTSKSGTFEFTSSKEGFYHFRIDDQDKKGFTLFVSNDVDYPNVKNTTTMSEPFRYLVSGKEYKKLIEAPALKPELEKFWIDWSGDKSRARNNIKTYYKRVETSNKFFSSHVEGWQSDRGLIYIIYGEPNKIYKTAQIETWIYGEEQNPLSLTFRFIKVDNPFTANDFRLEREDYYKPSWYRSIEAWRNGRVY
ncbi:MAG: GWxTD domain-containing protein [Bacteroidota bacterium]